MSELKCVLEEFNYGLELLKRKRPTEIVASIPTTPGAKTKRTLGPYPIALRLPGKDSSDYLPHNTVGGHLVGLQFGGPHEDWNLVPMYGLFNNGGPWSKLENDLFDEIYAPYTVGNAILTILVDYTGTSDQRVPTKFTVSLQYKDKKGNQIWSPAPLTQQKPKHIQYDPSPNFLWEIFKAQHAMEESKWFVEDHVKTSAGPKHIDYGKPLIVPARTFLARPYAVLDYMVYAINKAPLYAETLNNEAEFTPKQKNLIYQANIATNLGYIISCAPDDYVWEPGANSPAMDYGTDAFSITQKRGHLLWEGGHQKPEIDHIIPKGPKTRGSNAYSNAQVTSAFYNNQKRIAAGIPAFDILD